MEDLLKTLKGTKDFLATEQQIRNRIRKVCEDTFNLYGCKPVETPILNTFELMAYKYGGGSEILKEVYRLLDQGEREIALRYDLTTPFTKIIGQNPEMRFPFKRYEIGKVFRDGGVKLGRLREFVQCDVDVVGIESVAAEAELMIMAVDIFQKLSLNVVIQYNNRKLLSGILVELEVREDKINDVILSLDKLEKIGIDGVLDELRVRNIEIATINKLDELLNNPQSKELAFYEENFMNATVSAGINELKELTAFLCGLGIADKCVFNPFLARGLNIYTGTIYEIFLKEGSITSAIGSGGRYDKIIGTFLNNEKDYPAVGLSFGLDVIFYALMEKEGAPKREAVADLLIIPLGTSLESLKIAETLRRNNNKVEVDLSGRKLNKIMNYADKEGFPAVMIIGEDEIIRGVVIIRNMDTGFEEQYIMNELETLILSFE